MLLGIGIALGAGLGGLLARGLAFNGLTLGTVGLALLAMAALVLLPDVPIGGHLFSHVAAYHAGVAVRNVLVPIKRARVSNAALPWVTFTDPEAARVGKTEEQAMRQGAIRVIRLPWSAIDRA